MASETDDDKKDLRGAKPTEVGSARMEHEKSRNDSIWSAPDNKRVTERNPADADRQPAGSESGHREVKTSAEAWERPGTFHVERDREGRTARIEGWLALREGERPSAERGVQADTRREHGLDSRKDSGHIIGYCVGGPVAGAYSEELARANQMPMDARVNRSMIAGIEGQLRKDLGEGRNIYMVAEVSRGKGPDGEPAAHVSYKLWERGKDGARQPYAISETSVRTDQRPSQTTGQAVRMATGDQARAFYSPDRRGTLPGTM